MKNMILLILLLMFISPSWAGLTNTTIPVTKNGASNPPTLQNGSITDLGTSSGAGNVGIGSTNPGVALDVNGTVRANNFVTNGSGSSYLQLSANASDTGIPPTGYGNVYEKTDKNLYFQDDAGTITNVLNASNTWTLLGSSIYPKTISNNVGLGTSSPTTYLDVAGWPGIPSPIEPTTPGGTVANINGDSYMGEAGVNTGRLWISSNGNGGIIGWNTYYTGSVQKAENSSLPGYQLSLHTGTNGDGYYFTRAPATGGTQSFSTQVVINGSGNVGINTVDPNDIFEVNSASSSAVFKVQSTGNVGIGSNAPGQALDVQGTIRAISGGSCTTLYRCQGGTDAGIIQTVACTLCPTSTCVAMNGCF